MLERENKAENIKAILEECRKREVTVDDLLCVIAKAMDEKSIKKIENEGVKNTSKDIEYEITQILKEIGVPAHIVGYDFLRIGITYIWKHGRCSMTKTLYPSIAKEQKTTPTRVERAIRHAIEVAWDRGKTKVFEEYFGYSVNPSRGKPTNSEFIYMIVDYLNYNKI